MAGTIVNGQPPEADSFMNAFGSNFNDTAQNLFNADYIGFDSRLSNSGSPTLKNVFYSTFTSDDVDEFENFEYDIANDLYKTPDPSTFGTNYVIIKADDDNISWSSNNTVLMKIGTGKWVLYGTSGTDEVKRANIYKSLFFGTNGSDQLILDFTNVTSLKTTVSRDIGKRGHYTKMTVTADSGAIASYTGTFADTSTNDDCSSWSKLSETGSNSSHRMNWEIPDGTVRNQVINNDTIDEMGLDLTADENDNPADCQLSSVRHSPSVGEAIIICSGDISWTTIGTATFSNIDFFSDNSIPDFTSITESTEFNPSTLIFKDTTSESVTNAIPVINSQIDATSSEQISISADGGSNFTNVNNTEIARPTAGTELWRRIIITRTDLSKEDKVTEQACKFNFY